MSTAPRRWSAPSAPPSHRTSRSRCHGCRSAASSTCASAAPGSESPGSASGHTARPKENMNYTIDTAKAVIAINDDGGVKDVPLYSTEGFELLSDLWLKVGWNQKHSYTFTWMGIPVIQEPEDLVRMQEIIHTLQPDVIVETGVAHGGSLIFYASLLKTLGKGRVIGIDIDIRAHNRAALETHPL